MNSSTFPRSVISNESLDLTDSWLEFSKSNKDPKSFIGYVQSVEQKILSEGNFSVMIPKDFKKRIESSAYEFLNLMNKSDYINRFLTQDNFSLLFVFVYTISREKNQEKIEKKKNLIKVIQDLFLKFDKALIMDYIDPHMFQIFEHLFVLILEIINEKCDEKSKESICCCVFSMINQAMLTMNSIYFEIFYDGNEMSKITSSLLNNMIHKDLVYLGLNCLAKTFPHSGCENASNFYIIFKYLCILIERPSVNFEIYSLNFEKTLCLLDILSKFKEKNNKIIGNTLKQIEELMPKIFAWICSKFLEYCNEEPCNDFKKDSRNIGRLFCKTFEILHKQINFESNRAGIEYYERYPIKLFSYFIENIAETACTKAFQANFLQLQAYVLQFLVDYFRSYCKRKNVDEKKANLLKDPGLISLLLSQEFFIIEFGDTSLLNLANHVKTHWRTLWIYLSLNNVNLKPMIDTLISRTISNSKSITYVSRVINLLSELDIDQNSFIKDSLKEGLISQYISEAKTILPSIDDDSKELFFSLLNQLFSLRSLKEVQHEDYLKYLDDKIFLYSEANSLKCFGLVKKILTLEIPSVFITFKSLIKKTAPNPLLLNFLQILLSASESSDGCKKCFLNSGIIFVLKDKINPELLKNKEYTVELWTFILKIFKNLILSQHITDKHLEDIDFNSLAEFLSDSSNEFFAYDICENCISEVECILYRSTSVTSWPNIKTPQIIPLTIQMLTINSEEEALKNARTRIIHLLHTEIGISYLAYYNAFDIILKYFSVTKCLDISNFFEAIISKIIPFHIPPQALSKLIDIIKTTNNPKKKLILLQALQQAISNSNCSDEILTPSHYFYFTKEDFLEFSTPRQIESPFQNEISIFMWIKPCELKNYTLIQILHSKNNQIELSIVNQFPKVVIGPNIYTSSYPIPNEKWCFICLSVKSKKKTLRLTSRISICINGDFQNLFCSEESLKFEAKHFLGLVCGNNFEKNQGFSGKMSSIHVIYKHFSETECKEIYRLTRDNSLHFSLTSLVSDDSKLFKDIRKSSIFEWQPNLKQPNWYIKNNEKEKSVDHCKRFNGVSLFESIKLNGGMKIFLPLLSIKDQVQEEILAVTEIVLRIFRCTQSPLILTQEFILFAGYVLNCLTLFPKLTENLVTIVTSLTNDELRARLLKILLLNESIESIPVPEKASHLSCLISHIENLFACDRENLYVIYNHVKNLAVGDIEKAFEIMVKKTLDDKVIDAASLIIVQIVKDKSSNALEALVNVLAMRVETLTLDKSVLSGLFYAISEFDHNIQKKIIKFLFKDIESKKNKNFPVTDDYKKLVWSLNLSLPENALEQSVASEIYQIFSIENLPEVLKSGLFDIITKRIRFAEEGEQMNFYLCLFKQHLKMLSKYINESHFFPDWLIKTIEAKSNNQDLQELCIDIFTANEEVVKNPKLRAFVFALKDSQFLVKFLQQMCEHCCKENLLIKPEEFYEFLLLVDNVNHEVCDTEGFYCLIYQLEKYGTEHSFLSLNSALLETSTSKIKSNSRESRENRENQALQLLTMLIFRGMGSSEYNFLQILDDLCDKNNGFMAIKQESKRLIPEDHIFLVIFTNLCENLYKRDESFSQQIISFFNKYLVFERILPLLELHLDQDMFKKSLENRESFLKKLPQNHIINMIEIDEGIINTSVSSETFTKARSSSGDIFNSKETIKNLIKVPKDQFLNTITKNEWIALVHTFLIENFTNFPKKTQNFADYRSESNHGNLFAKEYRLQINEYLKNYDCDWINNFKQARILFRMHIAKKYKAYLRSLKRLKSILTSNHGKKLKVRPYFDAKNRFTLTKPCKSDSKDPKTLIYRKSPEKFYRSFSVAYFESIIEKSAEISSPVYSPNEGEGSEPDANLNGEEEKLEALSDTFPSFQILECERITIKGSYFGMLEINGNHLVYTSEGKKKPPDKYPYSSIEDIQKEKVCKRIWESSEIAEIICRRYMHQHSAIEMFLKSGKSYYFNLFTSQSRSELFACLRKWKGVEIIESISTKIVKAYTEKWLENKLDNFGYLLALNKLASRSFHDLSQYPIFPWVLVDYTSDKLDINNPLIYRDFKWPVGAQEETQREEVRRKYNQVKEQEMIAFNYGSHYSSGAVVLHYLVRIEPYTEQAKALQSDSFDVADRLFISMEYSWKSCCSHNGDVKELIPELFYFPDVLYNVNQNDLGIRQNKERVNDFEHPPWAKDIRDFVRKHRKCLESPLVTEELHNWIDLIFGAKQIGPLAVESLNVFYSVSYEDDFRKACASPIDDFSKQGMIEQAYHFGQTPVRLFSKVHKQKKADKSQKISIFEKYLSKSKLTEEEKRNERSPRGSGNDQEVKFSVKLEENGRIFALLACSTHLLAIKWESKISKYSLIKVPWTSNPVEFGQNYKSAELEGFSIYSNDNWMEYQSWKSTLPKRDIKMILDIGQAQFCIWEDKYIVSAFHTDNTFKLNSINKGELKKSVKYHCGLVTCVNATSSLLFSGSLDSTVISWYGSEDLQINNIYVGHSSSIRQIQALESYQVVISLSSSGTILMHDIRNAECLRKLAEPNANPARVMAVSELGIVAVALMDKEFLKIFSVNGMDWLDSRPGAEDVWCMAFNRTGEYLVTGSNKSIAFFDILDNGNNGLENIMYQSVDNTVLAFAISKEEEYLVFASSVDSSKVGIYVLKVQSKSESQQTIKIISQFA